MKISIITVCYNAVKTIENTILSVKIQNYDNIEYIIIDGNSTDGTQAIIKKHIDIIDYFISESDKGMYDAINKGIKIASGEIIGILNSDDEFNMHNVIDLIAKTFKNNLSLESVFGDVSFINTNSKITRYYNSKLWKPFFFYFGIMPPHPSFYCKKELFDKYGLYRTDLEIASDYEMLLRLLYTKKISYKYLPFNFVTMKIGGKSTNGIKSNIKINNEILKASKINKLKTNLFFIYLKYLYRIFEIKL